MQEQAILALRGLLAAGGRLAVVTEGTSMQPFLRTGDQVLLEGVRPDQLRLGDVIAFLQDGRLVVHRFGGRVTRDGSLRLRQKGDNLAGSSLIAPEALIGRACSLRGAAGSCDLTRGAGRRRNRVLGLRVLLQCAGRETASALARRLGLRRAAVLPELEILALATRLELAPEQEARLALLLEQRPQWPLLLSRAAGLLPLLHHHLSRPALAPLVPDEVRATLDQAYRRNSLKNLRMQGLLRRILVQAREAGVPVILLKGAGLARWVYGDLGLRPMNDLDLLCRKQDEPALERILTGLGGYQADNLEDIQLQPTATRRAVQEQTNHGTPWWFRSIARVEVHYHLLSRLRRDDPGLTAALWAQAVARDWDGLETLSLGPVHQALHVAEHLGHHFHDGGINLYWFCDLREVLRLTAPDPAELQELAARLGQERVCARLFALVGAGWGSAGDRPDPAEATRALARLLANPAVRKQTSVLPYLKAVLAVRHAVGLRGKGLYLLQLLFPIPRKLVRRYGISQPIALPLLYLIDPFVRAALILKDLGRHVQHRLRH